MKGNIIWKKYIETYYKLLDQKANTGAFDSPYRFNVKEYDPETSLYYYGARYYSGRTSVWLSVDPLAHEFQSLTPYHFSANNPIMIVDYDGRDTSFADNNTRNLYKTARKNVVNQIETLKGELKNSKEGSKKHGRISNSIKNYEKLLKDFQEIEKSSTPMVHYSIDDSNLEENVNGLTGRGEEGPIQVSLRAGHDEAVIHENRHVYQIFDNGIGKFNYTIEHEVEAFEYQRIYSPSSVNNFIFKAFDKYHRNHNPNFEKINQLKLSKYKLIDAIKDVYPEFKNK